MLRLLEQDVVDLVEEGAQLKPLDRAVRIFARATGQSFATAAKAPISDRDLALIELYIEMFGGTAEFVEPCNECGEVLEGALELGQVLEAGRASGRDDQIRTPSSHEIARLAQGENEKTVLSACLGRSIDDVQSAQAEIEAAFPHVSVELPLICPTCDAEKSARFDIAQFLWPELERIASRWFDEVHRLAKAYGWEEQTIASMAPQRRSQYLQRIST